MLSNQPASSTTSFSSRMQSRLLPSQSNTKDAVMESNPIENKPVPSSASGDTTKQTNWSKPPLFNGRRERSSFQGLGVVNRKGKKPHDANFVDPAKVEQMKNDRRRKSMNVMRKSAQSTQIRQMLENTLDDCNSAVHTKGTAEERLKSVLTKAKETGMTADEIFSFFNGGNPNTTHITKESFLGSIEKLGGNFLVVTDEDLNEIISKIDKNNDGSLTLAEFKNYCYYDIQSIAWKAERTRLEKSGEMKMLQAQLSRRFKPGDSSDESDCGEEVHQTSKFFWKTNNNVEIRLWFQDSLNVITLQLYSQTYEIELPSIFICKNKVDHQHTKSKEDVTMSLHKRKGCNEDLEGAAKEATWESIAKYLVARLQLWERNLDNSEVVKEVHHKEGSAHISSDAKIVPYLRKLFGMFIIVRIIFEKYFCLFSKTTFLFNTEIVIFKTSTLTR